MDKMYNVQQLEDRFGQQTKFPVLISMKLSLLNHFKQTLDDTMIWKLQEVYITKLKNTQQKLTDRVRL